MHQNRCIHGKRCPTLLVLLNKSSTRYFRTMVSNNIVKKLTICLVILAGATGVSPTQNVPTTPPCDCPCGEGSSNSTTVCLTDAQMRRHVNRVEMAPDRMGNHVNLQGVAVFRIALDKHGRVDCAEVLSGRPIATSLLMASVKRWRFTQFVRNGTAIRACGRLSLKFSVVEGASTVEVITQDQAPSGGADQ
jgi:hypothetical protein